MSELKLRPPKLRDFSAGSEAVPGRAEGDNLEESGDKVDQEG